MWHAIYVKSRHEKKVADKLKGKGIETYVPIRKVMKQWSDRKKWIEEVVVSCYVFVNGDGINRDEILQTNGVVGFVRNNKKDAKVSNQEIEIMKSILNEPDVKVSMESNEFSVGQFCEVVNGPLQGKKVKLYEFRGKEKVGVFFEEMKMGLTVDINTSCLSFLD